MSCTEQFLQIHLSIATHHHFSSLLLLYSYPVHNYVSSSWLVHILVAACAQALFAVFSGYEHGHYFLHLHFDQ